MIFTGEGGLFTCVDLPQDLEKNELLVGKAKNRPFFSSCIDEKGECDLNEGFD